MITLRQCAILFLLIIFSGCGSGNKKAEQKSPEQTVISGEMPVPTGTGSINYTIHNTNCIAGKDVILAYDNDTRTIMLYATADSLNTSEGKNNSWGAALAWVAGEIENGTYPLQYASAVRQAVTDNYMAVFESGTITIAQVKNEGGGQVSFTGTFTAAGGTSTLNRGEKKEETLTGTFQYTGLGID